MLKRMFCKQLWFFFPVILLGALSCVKEAAKSGGIPAAKKETETAENTLNIHQPVQKSKIDYSKGAVENDVNLNDIQTVLTIHWWTTEFEESHITFKTDNTYLLFTAPEGDWFGSGTYRVEGNTVIVNYPSETKLWKGLPETTMKWLFNGTQPVELTYDKEYRDFDVLTCLSFGDKILKNYMIESPFGETYELDGFEVIKYHRKSRVLILENLRMREYPEMTAYAVMLRRAIDVPDANTGHFVMRSFVSNVVYAHTVNWFDAKTVKTDTIDGVTAPWYRLRIVLNDFAPTATVWVFGGYLKELAPNEQENTGDYAEYVRRLIDNGVVIE
jgi:hypothetical protein